MINRKCCNCKVETHEFTKLLDENYWCKMCYDEGTNMLLKGIFTKEEFDKEKALIETYINTQKGIIRNIFKLVEGTKKEEMTLEDINTTIKLYITEINAKEQEISLSKYLRTRKELLKDLRLHMEVINEIDYFQILSQKSGLEMKELLNIINTTKLDYDNSSNILMYNTLYNYYNGKIY
jgi:hypothetical protein